MELKLKKATLPESKIEVELGLSFGEQLQLAKKVQSDTKDTVEFIKELVCKSIKKWSATEEITEANVLMLSAQDASFIFEIMIKEINPDYDFLKKNVNTNDAS